MSREIKFRAWDVANKEMVYNVHLNDGKPVKPGYQWFDQQNTVRDSEPMQYTGLKDKNDMEIYEGDILRLVIDPDWEKDVPLEQQTVLVDMRNGAWGFQHTFPNLVNPDDREWRSFWNQYDDMWPASYFEVIGIGNIYENKDPLETAGDSE